LDSTPCPNHAPPLSPKALLDRSSCSSTQRGNLRERGVGGGGGLRGD
jgi:hypothetical protein